MKKRFFAIALLATSLFPSCKNQDFSDEEDLKRAALEQYATLVLANYDECYNSAVSMKQTIDQFLAAPSATGFEACKTAWLEARIPYGQSEAFRFYAGPIDDADGPEGLINAWPMDENFIDYVQGQPNAGLINNPAAQPVINKELLVGLNEVLSETAIFTGWHAIEFLLWGQDFSTSGPGARPYTDYIVGGGGTAANQERRAQYLRVVVDLLIEHIGQVRDEWKVGGTYREEFLGQKTNAEAMGLIFFGMKEFTKTELSGERMFVAIDTQDQEHEHSCFSDNTLVDLKMNLKGIKNVYFGIYETANGTKISDRSFKDIVNLLDAEKATAVQLAFDDAETKMNAIPAPFDQTIVNNPGAITPVIDAIKTLGDRLTEAGIAIGAEF